MKTKKSFKQLQLQIAAQLRRAILTPEERRERRQYLRIVNGQARAK